MLKKLREREPSWKFYGESWDGMKKVLCAVLSEQQQQLNDVEQDFYLKQIEK